MKKIVVILSLIISINGITQNLESKIPNNALAVATINGNQVFDLISMAELDNLAIIKKMISSENIESVADLGFNLESKAHYFYQIKDTVQYHNFMINLTDKSKFENILSKKEKNSIEEHLGYNFVFNGKTLSAWNDNTLILSTVILPNIPYKYSSNDYKTTQPTQEYDNIVESVKEAKDATTDKKYAKVTKVEDYSAVLNKIDEKTKILLKNNALTILNRKSSNSIATNKNYNAGKEKNAAAYLWVGNYGDVTNKILETMMGEFSPYGKMDLSKNMFGLTEFKSSLFFNDDEVKLTADISIANSWKKTYKKIYGSKLNKNFFKYINKNETLAYFSMAMDTQAILEEYPIIMTDLYSSIMPKFNEEISIAAELLSIVLDEKAIGEVITGNALFILNDIGEKEVTYTSYTYDEDYNSTEVTKTKKEIIPDFTIMIGSENRNIIAKIMKLATKHKVAEQNGGYIKFNTKKTDAPFDMFFVLKDDIAFLTNSQKQINSITSNNFPVNLGIHKKMLKNSLSTFYVNAEEILNKVPKSSFSKKDIEFLDNAKGNLKETYFTTSRLKGNKFKSEYVIKTANDKGNSLKLLLHIIESFSK